MSCHQLYTTRINLTFLYQIDNATTDKELKKVIEESSDVLIDNGITTAPSLVQLEDKESSIVTSVYFIKIKGGIRPT